MTTIPIKSRVSELFKRVSEQLKVSPESLYRNKLKSQVKYRRHMSNHKIGIESNNFKEAVSPRAFRVFKPSTSILDISK